MAGEAGDGAARAHAADHGVEPPAHLLDDLGAGGGLVGQRVCRVPELVHVEGALLAGEALGQVLVVVGVALLHVGAGHHHLGAERLEVEHLLPAHLVGDDEGEPVAALRGHQRQPEAGVAGGGLDQAALVGAEASILLGGRDHGEPDAVLDGAARVLALELQEELAGPGVEAVELQHRGPADEGEDAVEGCGHLPNLSGPAPARNRACGGGREAGRAHVALGGVRRRRK